jgi:hypothetical protein
MSPQRPRHPRAGLAIGAVVLAGWLSAIGAAIATDGSADVEDRAAPGAGTAETRVARPGRAGPAYNPAKVD